MAYCQQIALPSQEPVSLALAKQFLRLPSGFTADDAIIQSLISDAREQGERISGLVLAERQFEQTLDSFPYFTDTVQSQLAYPPSYYSLPRYSTTLWNYSQMIKLQQAPAFSVDKLGYIDTNGNPQTLNSGTDFIFDPATRLPRIFPMVGQYWPACLYTPNAVAIIFTAGFNPNPTATLTIGLPSPTPNPQDQQGSYTVVSGIPNHFILAILNHVAFHYQNRGGGDQRQLDMIENVFRNNGIMDFAPTRG